MAGLESLLTGGVLGVAIGDASATALEPVFEPITQDAWDKAVGKGVTRLLPPEQVAQLVAQALLSQTEGADEVARDGYDPIEFNKMVQLALKAPSSDVAPTLFLRGINGYSGGITDAQLRHAYAKSGLEFQFWDAISSAAETQLLTPAELALGIVRSTVADPGLLAKQLDTSDSNVDKYPVAALDALKEAAVAGINRERLQVMVGAIGLPLGAIAAAEAQFRGIITKGAYYQAILEGDTRPEWADAIYEYAREILSPVQAVENTLRGYADQATMYARTARRGMTQADTDVIFQNAGRPLAVHQITTGLARGGVFNPEPNEITDPYEASVHESDIKPAYYDLAIANKYTLPGYFVVKAMLSAGAITVDEATTIFTQEGWPPDLAAKAAAALAGGSGTTSSSHVKSAQTSGITKARTAYTGGSITQAQAQTALSGLDVPASDQATILRYWDVIRGIESTVPPGQPGGPATTTTNPV